MTTMHTEGLWLMCESATHVTVTNAHGDAVFHDDKRIPGVMADARLIAAAPDLLTTLRRLTLAAERREYTMGDACNLIAVKAELADAAKQARAAIAKATGEQP